MKFCAVIFSFLFLLILINRGRILNLHVNFFLLHQIPSQRRPKIKGNFLKKIIERRCLSGYYYTRGRRNCQPCLCDKLGSEGGNCQLNNGQCYCKIGYNGQKCTSCQSGYYKNIYKKLCQPCDCNRDGSKGIECDREGRCRCRNEFGGKKCDRCLNLNRIFQKDCTEDCPEMYRPVAEDFEEFLKQLNELERRLNDFDAGRNTIDEFESKIEGLRGELSRISLNSPDFSKLWIITDSLRNLIRIYTDRGVDLKELLHVVDKIMKELKRIEEVGVRMKGILDNCVRTCKKADGLDEDRKDFLKELKEIGGRFSNVAEESANVGKEVERLANKAQHNKQWSQKNLDEAVRFSPVNYDDDLVKLESHRLNKIVEGLDELLKDLEEIRELYEDTKNLQANYVLKMTEAFDGFILEPYKSNVAKTIGTILDTLRIYQDELKLDSPELSFRDNITRLYELIESDLDKLDEFEILAEKLTGDDRSTNETLTNIFDVLSRMTAIVFNGTEILRREMERNRMEEKNLDEKLAEVEVKVVDAIDEMEKEDGRLKKDLAYIEDEMKETLKEVDTLEEVLGQLETIKYLTIEVTKLKVVKEEFDKVDNERLCDATVELA